MVTLGSRSILFDKVQYFLPLSLYASCILSKISYQPQGHEDTLPMFSSENSVVLTFMFKSMIHLKFIHVYALRQGLRIFLPPPLSGVSV